ncbi:hypothetical protein TNCV_2032561 [Trichonephila clavipes]|nr:hypothetical protein TNCV_2032561 [Trichonephila clavipes]
MLPRLVVVHLAPVFVWLTQVGMRDINKLALGSLPISCAPALCLLGRGDSVGKRGSQGVKVKLPELKLIKIANEETDLVEIKVKLKNMIALQRNIDELRSNYYDIPNVKDAELASIDEELKFLEECLEKLERNSIRRIDLPGENDIIARFIKKTFKENSYYTVSNTRRLHSVVPKDRIPATCHSTLKLPIPLAGVNRPSHSYTSPLKAHPSFQDDEAEKKL